MLSSPAADYTTVVPWKQSFLPGVHAPEPVAVDVFSLADLGVLGKAEFVLDVFTWEVRPECLDPEPDSTVWREKDRSSITDLAVEASMAGRVRSRSPVYLFPTPLALLRGLRVTGLAR